MLNNIDRNNIIIGDLMKQKIDKLYKTKNKKRWIR